jgi:hypothetical protein
MAQCQCSNEQHNLQRRQTWRLVPRWRRRWRRRRWRPGLHNSRSRAGWDLSRRSHLRKHCQGGIGLGAFGVRLKQHGQTSSERTDAWSVGYDARPHANQCKAPANNILRILRESPLPSSQRRPQRASIDRSHHTCTVADSQSWVS